MYTQNLYSIALFLECLIAPKTKNESWTLSKQVFKGSTESG